MKLASSAREINLRYAVESLSKRAYLFLKSTIVSAYILFTSLDMTKFRKSSRKVLKLQSVMNSVNLNKRKYDAWRICEFRYSRKAEGMLKHPERICGYINLQTFKEQCNACKRTVKHSNINQHTIHLPRKFFELCRKKIPCSTLFSIYIPVIIFQTGYVEQ